MYSHLGDERSALAHGLAPHPRVLLPIDGEVVWQACNKEPKDENRGVKVMEPKTLYYPTEKSISPFGLKGILTFTRSRSGFQPQKSAGACVRAVNCGQAKTLRQCALSESTTDMRENVWARLRDSRPGVCLIHAI